MSSKTFVKYFTVTTKGVTVYKGFLRMHPLSALECVPFEMRNFCFCQFHSRQVI